MILPCLNELSVSRVHVHGVGLDALNTRQGIERLLGTVQSPADVGPTTILCIQHMTVHLTARQASPRQWASGTSTRHMADALDALARAAVRPALGLVPSHAKAVRFADRAEMLACLVHDWLAGVAPGRWWWRDLLGSHSTAEAVRLACLASPDFVPTLFERLARQGDLKRFVQALSPAAAQDLLTAVLQAHQLPGLDMGNTSPATPPATTPLQHAPHAASDKGGDQTMSARPPLPATDSSGLAPPAWVKRCIPMQLLADLNAGQRTLVVLSLALVRAPGELRGAATQASLVTWLRQPPRTASGHQADPSGHTASDMYAPTDTDAGGRLASLAPADHADPRSKGLPAPAHTNAPPAHPPESPAPCSSASSQPASLAGALVSTPHHEARPQALPTQQPHQERTSSALKGHPRQLPDAHRLAPARLTHDLELPWASAPGQSVLLSPHPPDGALTLHTQFGGLFYLVNAALALGLYNDFTKPAEPGIGLPVWDFLALAGLQLAGPARQALLADPAWSMLASLSARQPDEAPGAHFEPPDIWQMPLAWLAPFADRRGAWQWHADESRLHVHHPAGFTVVDTRRDAGDAPRQAQGAVRPYRAGHRFQLRAAMPTPACSPASEPANNVRLARWCHWVMPYLALRLAQALRIKPPTQAGPMLMRQPARLALSAARLDVYLPLAQLPVAVRMAGLDRNPGWVPAAGRTLAFHYE